MVIPKIKFEFFYLGFLFQIKKVITSSLKKWKEEHKNIELILRFKYAKKCSPFKKFHGCLIHIKTARFVVSLMENGNFLLEYKSSLKKARKTLR